MEYLSCFFLNFDFCELLLTYVYFIIHIGLAISNQYSSHWKKTSIISLQPCDLVSVSVSNNSNQNWLWTEQTQIFSSTEAYSVGWVFLGGKVQQGRSIKIKTVWTMTDEMIKWEKNMVNSLKMWNCCCWAILWNVLTKKPTQNPKELTISPLFHSDS